MNKMMLLDKYPIFVEEIARDETECRNVDDVLARFKEKIEAHPVATYIGEFDHYGHVAAQPDGEIAEGIKASKHVLFCVANAIPNPLIAAARPRTVSVVELADQFVISHLEAPVEKVNRLLADWVETLRRSA